MSKFLAGLDKLKYNHNFLEKIALFFIILDFQKANLTNKVNENIYSK